MIDPELVLCLVLGAAAVVAVLISGATSTPARSRWAVATAALHPLLVVGLLYPLVAHTRLRLGDWPKRNGEAGFPSEVFLHHKIAQGALGALLLGVLSALPPTVLLCACRPGLRPSLRYLGIYGCLTVAAIDITQLAPAPFLDWWWD